MLLDHAMPEMDGTQTFAELREIDASVPVIITSGFSEPEIAMPGDKPQAAGFIKKPYRLTRLGEELRTVLNRW